MAAPPLSAPLLPPLLPLLTLLCLLGLGAGAAPAAKNVLIVLTDDLGFGDVEYNCHDNSTGTLCYAMLCYTILCYAILCYAVLYYAMLYHTMLCHTNKRDVVHTHLHICIHIYVHIHTGMCAETPNLARLARSRHSAVLHRFYATAGICSPTRAALLTGRNNQRDCIQGGLGCDAETPAPYCAQGKKGAHTDADADTDTTTTASATE
jgi:arylsulfatase A-like enzyme